MSSLDLEILPTKEAIIFGINPKMWRMRKLYFPYFGSNIREFRSKELGGGGGERVEGGGLVLS
jgi:hypothetical protein